MLAGSIQNAFLNNFTNGYQPIKPMPQSGAVPYSQLPLNE